MHTRATTSNLDLHGHHLESPRRSLGAVSSRHSRDPDSGEAHGPSPNARPRPRKKMRPSARMQPMHTHVVEHPLFSMRANARLDRHLNQVKSISPARSCSPASNPVNQPAVQPKDQHLEEVWQCPILYHAEGSHNHRDNSWIICSAQLQSI